MLLRRQMGRGGGRGDAGGRCTARRTVDAPYPGTDRASEYDQVKPVMRQQKGAPERGALLSLGWEFSDARSGAHGQPGRQGIS